MAAYLINVLQAETTLLRRLQQRASVLVAFIVMGYFAYEAIRLQFAEVSKVLVFRIEQKEPASWEVVGDTVARLTTPADKIQCLGYMPGVYLRARRENVSRFTTTEKIGHVRSHADFVARELEERLRDDPPVLLVLSAEDYYRLQGQDPEGRWPRWVKLAEWLDRNYQLVEDIPRFGTVYIFKRNDRIDPTRDPDLRSHLPAIQKAGEPTP